MDTNGIMARFRKVVKEKAEARTQFVYDRLMKYTPVYTGQTRQSWNISEGKPNYSTVDVGGSKENPLPPGNQKAVATTDFPVFYIANGKPHILILENGNSKQAPVGMLRRAIADLP
jgi:hypothetical protein